MKNTKIKNIGISHDEITFLTSDLKGGACDIPIFLHNAMIKKYSFNHRDLNKIVKDCRINISNLCNFSDFSHEIENNGIEKMDEMTEEIRSIFYKACDEINNYLRIF